jgi:N-methylhydantoinase B
MVTADSEQIRASEIGGLDPITFEVIRNGLSSVVDEMAVMVEKVAFSTVVSEGRDFSGAICASNGDLVAQGDQDIPLIGGTVPYRIKAMLGIVPEQEIREGDVFLLNDPFLGGTHAQDVSAIMPVFSEGERIGFVQTAAHYPDIGGASPGSFNPAAASSYAEALLIPPIHIVRGGKLDKAVESLILRNVRVPEVIRGDLRGTIEACRAGHERLQALLAKYGKEMIKQMMVAVVEYSERLLRNEVRALPDGSYSWTDYIDRDPLGDSEAPLPVKLRMTISGDRLKYDFAGTAPQARGPVNIPVSALYASCMTATKHIFNNVPLTQGLLNAIDFLVPPRTVVSAEHPVPVSGGAAAAAEKVVSCVHGCFMQVVPERAMACPTNLTNMCIGGFDARPGRDHEYVMYLWMAGGWGARPAKKDNHTFLMPLAAGTRTQPAETLERLYPILIDGYGMKADSEGAGRHRGGFGFFWNFRLTHEGATIAVQGDRERVPAWGFDGGLSPAGNRLIYAPGTPDEENLGIMRGDISVQPGLLLDYSQGGGGGWGDPHERPVEWVVEDVLNGLVSVERARDVYGVAMQITDEETLTHHVDEAETRRLRGSDDADSSSAAGEGDEAT